MKSRHIDLTGSKVSTTMNEIQLYTQQLKKPSNQNATNSQLIQQNRRILDILKKIETKIDKQLETHKKQMLSINPHHKSNFSKDQMRILQEKELNNNKLLNVLQKDLQNILARKKLFQNGLEEKVRLKKNQLQDKIMQVKSEIKKLSVEEKSQQKKLVSYQDLSQAYYLKEYGRMQEQLRVYSSKYVKSLAKYNKLTQQLAISTDIQPPFQIPQEIYNQLDEREQQQYKQYQSIVKLCSILAKRNDSEINKANRIYTEKLKQLQKTILSLTQIQKAISIRETEILQGKKNVDMIKYKLTNQQKIDKELFRLSYVERSSNGTVVGFGEGMRQKSYSSAKLGGGMMGKNSVEGDGGNLLLNNKLRTRGLSFAKLPAKLKP